VSGLIVKTSDKWQNGGFFKKGEVLLQIEKHQYENQFARAKAQLAQAKAAYVQEQGQAYVAKKEWDRRQSKEANPAAKALALREPQLESAKAQFEAAEADLLAAKLSLDKTVIRAPFDGIIQKKTADIGQFISTGQLLAEIYAVDYAEVRVPLTQSNQYLLDLPGLNGAGASKAKVVFKNQGGQTEIEGELVRTEAVLDEVTKVLYGVVEIKDPYALDTKTPREPLRIGSYVEVNIPGREVEGLYVLPEFSLRRGNKLWVVNEQGLLESRQVQLLSNYQGENIIYEGIDDKTAVVVGSVGKALEGREVNVRLVNIEPASDEPEKSTELINPVSEQLQAE
jgi:RND family efflux transporter MFP subunit